VVELSGNVVTVVVARVFVVRVTLCVHIVAGIEHSSLDLISTLDSVRQLLNAVEAVVDTARRARSDSIRYSKDCLRDLVVPRASQHLFRI
jgi:diacylglycerol kinase